MVSTNKRKRTSAISSDLVGTPYTPSETPESDVATGTVVFDVSPFEVEWVRSTNPPAKKLKKSKKDVSEPKQEEGIVGAGLGGLYTVSPGEQWSNLRKYRNFVVNPHNEQPKDGARDKFEAKHKFEVGQFVFVNHSETPKAIVTTDKESWVAQVREVRAEGQHAVYIRVLWFYWPEELPTGREPYHGERELIASNYHQIIDAMTVSGKANVHHLVDVHKMSAISADDLYWRQTLDTRKKPLKPSQLAKECICKSVTNPDVAVVRCSNQNCEKWQHEQCLIDSILNRYWEERGGKIDGNQKPLAKSHSQANDEDSDIGDTIEASPKKGGLLEMGRTLLGALRGGSNKKSSKASGKHSKKARRNSKPFAKAVSEQPWSGKLAAKLQFEQSPEGRSEFNGKATIYRISTSKGEDILEDFDEIEVNCLFCKQSFVEIEDEDEEEEVNRTVNGAKDENLDPSLFVSQNSVVGVPTATEKPADPKPDPAKRREYDAVREAAASNGGDETSSSE